MHATQLALILEDALTDNATTKIGDFMVRGPICALPWQPISFVRQQMLANSFSYLPMQWETEQGAVWKLVSDFHVARYLRLPGNVSGGERKRRLAKTVKDATDEGLLELEDATSCSSDTAVEDALPHFSGDSLPLLVHHPKNTKELMGIVTAYDLS
jgi:hypothetical protein